MATIIKRNLLLDLDSYKWSHFMMYPDGMTSLFSYIEPRLKGEIIVPFGLQMWIKKHLLDPITQEDIDEAADIAAEHGEPFNKAGFEFILKKYNGYMPLIIRSLPEGTPVASLKALVTVELTAEAEKDGLGWLVSLFETTMQRGIWYPTTIATNDLKNRKMLKWFYDKSSDQHFMLDFSLHSFASRGVTTRETAEVGGLAHLIYFRGTDDVVCLKTGREFYGVKMAGFSVRASEHTIQCAYGPSKEGQARYIDKMISLLGPNIIVSAVMDGYDIYREVDTLCEPQNVAKIKASGGKFVVRPDSGDPLVVIPRILEKLEKAFGVTINSKGKKVLNSVGIIWGDGIDSNMMYQIADKVFMLGFAPENVIYGSGGGLLQKVNRDTFSFAQKGSAMKINDNWIDTVKSPITDMGKKSKGGRLDDPNFVTFYEGMGKLLVDDSMETIRTRALTAI